MSNRHIFIVDDDDAIRQSMRYLLECAQFDVSDFSSASTFLNDPSPKRGCLICDIRMPDVDGLVLQDALRDLHPNLPIVFLTGFAEVPTAVLAMQAGAVDFLEKPVGAETLIASINRALAIELESHEKSAQIQTATQLIELLTQRELSVLDKLVMGKANKVVAFELGISTRTIELHRSRIMRKMDANSLSDLVRVALIAGRLHRASSGAHV